jgi:sirohydrochlorin cobaltochelatase
MRKSLQTIQTRVSQLLSHYQVVLAYLEQEHQPLLSVISETITDTTERLVILPLSLPLQSWEEREIPRQVVLIKECFPTLDVRLLPPLGEHPVMVETIAAIVQATGG